MRRSADLDEIEHLLAAVVDARPVGAADLMFAEIGRDVGETVVAVVVAPLQNILEHILRSAVIARRNRLAAELVESLARAVDERLDPRESALLELGADGHSVRRAERVGRAVAPAVGRAAPWQASAETAHDLEQRRLSAPDASPEPEAALRVVAPRRVGYTPSEQVGDLRPVEVADLKPGRDRARIGHEKMLQTVDVILR